VSTLFPFPNQLAVRPGAENIKQFHHFVWIQIRIHIWGSWGSPYGSVLKPDEQAYANELPKDNHQLTILATSLLFA
jgi:hypothetical protein